MISSRFYLGFNTNALLSESVEAPNHAGDDQSKIRCDSELHPITRIISTSNNTKQIDKEDSHRAKKKGNSMTASLVYPQHKMQHGRTQISGLDCDPRMIGTNITAAQPQTPSLEDQSNNEHIAAVANLETEVQALWSRIEELERHPRLQIPEDA